MPKVKSNHSEFLIGDAVRYIGDAIIPIGVEGLSRKRYADIVLHIFEYGVGGELLSCACLLPDGRVTTWIPYADLKLDPFNLSSMRLCLIKHRQGNKARCRADFI